MQLGQEICEQFLKSEYQYFMTCHIDKNHTHLHCVFNNTNCIDGRTFETHENRSTTKQDRSFQKLMNITDEVCRQHHLSVIEHPEMGKGKNHWEWDMSRQGLSWKAKLKFTIDQVIKESENFEDFLRKCADFGVIVEYNLDHKIDLKFMLAEQKERGREEKKYRKEQGGDIAEYHETCKQVLELYPSGNIPKVENLEKHIASLQKKLSKKNSEYNQADKKSRELSEATRTIEEYLRHEQSRGQQQKRKRNDLE